MRNGIHRLFICPKKEWLFSSQSELFENFKNALIGWIKAGLPKGHFFLDMLIGFVFFHEYSSDTGVKPSFVNFDY